MISKNSIFYIFTSSILGTPEKLKLVDLVLEIPLLTLKLDLHEQNRISIIFTTVRRTKKNFRGRNFGNSLCIQSSGHSIWSVIHILWLMNHDYWILIVYVYKTQLFKIRMKNALWPLFINRCNISTPGSAFTDHSFRNFRMRICGIFTTENSLWKRHRRACFSFLLKFLFMLFLNPSRRGRGEMNYMFHQQKGDFSWTNKFTTANRSWQTFSDSQNIRNR